MATGHGLQCPPFGPVKPALHVQLVTSLLPKTAVECAGQSIQCESKKEDTPVKVEYMSRPQRGTQVEMLVAPMNALIRSTCQNGIKQNLFVFAYSHVKDITENLPAAHLTHVLTLIAFVAPEYVPA